MPPRGLMSPDFLIELVYSVILMISCLIIFFKTSEIYKLTSHKGIKYFRMTFLFFAFAYFLRFFAKILVLGLIFTGTMFPVMQFAPLTSLLVLYTGFMATFYLLYGLSQKRLSKELPETDILHVTAIVLSSIIVFLGVPIIFIAIILFLLFYLLFVSYSDYIKSKQKKDLPQFYVVYFLLILVSLLNILDILIPDIFGRIQTLIYITSILLFLAILYRVMRILNVKPMESRKRKKK